MKNIRLKSLPYKDYLPGEVICFSDHEADEIIKAGIGEETTDEPSNYCLLLRDAHEVLRQKGIKFDDPKAEPRKGVIENEDPSSSEEPGGDSLQQSEDSEGHDTED